MPQWVRIQVIGERERLPADIVAADRGGERLTAGNRGLTLIVAFNYGAREEITRAARADRRRGEGRHARSRRDRRGTCRRPSIPPACPIPICSSGRAASSGSAISCSGSSPIPNSCSSTEHWPDFDRDIFARAIGAFQQRERRYGGISRPGRCSDSDGRPWSGNARWPVARSQHCAALPRRCWRRRACSSPGSAGSGSRSPSAARPCDRGALEWPRCSPTIVARACFTRQRPVGGAGIACSRLLRAGADLPVLGGEPGRLGTARRAAQRRGGSSAALCIAAAARLRGPRAEHGFRATARLPLRRGLGRPIPPPISPAGGSAGRSWRPRCRPTRPGRALGGAVLAATLAGLFVALLAGLPSRSASPCSALSWR